MYVIALLAGLSSAAAGPLPAGEGAIIGVVVHDADGQTPVDDAEVVLRVGLDGQFVPVEQTIADAAGRFVFQGLPVGPEYVYLPGANHQGIHYPGPRVRLGVGRPHVRVQIEVSDASTGSNPLVVRRHDIVIHPQPGALEVTETILVENPTSASYLGTADSDAEEPVTLQLSIPSDFEKTTFQREFFGRRFSLRDGKLVTSIPWTPGQQELEFTYVLRNAQGHRVWERPLDLPTDRVRVTVVSDKPEEVSCNLHSDSEAAAGTVAFQSGETLPAGHVLRVELGALPVSWTAYSRWAALAILVALIAAVSAIAMRRRGRQPPVDSGESSPPAAKAEGSAPRENKRQKRLSRKKRSRTRRAA